MSEKYITMTQSTCKITVPANRKKKWEARGFKVAEKAKD